MYKRQPVACGLCLPAPWGAGGDRVLSIQLLCLQMSGGDPGEIIFFLKFSQLAPYDFDQLHSPAVCNEKETMY